MGDKPVPIRELFREAEMSVKKAFDLKDRVAVITGGAGFLGVKHAEAVAEMGGIPVLVDLDPRAVEMRAEEVMRAFGGQALGVGGDITDPDQVANVLSETLKAFGEVDILINNAANNPKVDPSASWGKQWSRLEQFTLDIWNQDLAVGLTGAFLCSQIFGSEMARRERGVILNIASDLAIIAPDQRIYRKPGLPEDIQPVKPISYSVIKAGLVGLTRYLATYWASRGVRANALCPGGVEAGQEADFVSRLTNLIPLGRMAKRDEYKAAVIFLVSDASSYMTGTCVVMDGGRTCW